MIWWLNCSIAGTLLQADSAYFMLFLSRLFSNRRFLFSFQDSQFICTWSSRDCFLEQAFCKSTEYRLTLVLHWTLDCVFSKEHFIGTDTLSCQLFPECWFLFLHHNVCSSTNEKCDACFGFEVWWVLRVVWFCLIVWLVCLVSLVVWFILLLWVCFVLFLYSLLMVFVFQIHQIPSLVTWIAAQNELLWTVFLPPDRSAWKAACLKLNSLLFHLSPSQQETVLQIS